MKKFLIFVYSKVDYLLLYLILILIYKRFNNKVLKKLQESEIIMDKYKISNHETKNQLLTIRNMIEKNSIENTKMYIDKLIENDYQDDESLLIKSTKIPAGGLRSLIYSKLLYMKNNNIKFNLEVDFKLRFIELDKNIVLDICKIIGVFLDNAIEETEKMEKGIIKIELNLHKEHLNILISNPFEKIINLKKISNNRYTTKQEGHGYGLMLVRTIIKKNNNLENICLIKDNLFTQILKIKL